MEVAQWWRGGGQEVARESGGGPMGPMPMAQGLTSPMDTGGPMGRWRRMCLWEPMDLQGPMGSWGPLGAYNLDMAGVPTPVLCAALKQGFRCDKIFKGKSFIKLRFLGATK